MKNIKHIIKMYPVYIRTGLWKDNLFSFYKPIQLPSLGSNDHIILGFPPDNLYKTINNVDKYFQFQVFEEINLYQVTNNINNYSSIPMFLAIKLKEQKSIISGLGYVYGTDIITLSDFSNLDFTVSKTKDIKSADVEKLYWAREIIYNGLPKI